MSEKILLSPPFEDSQGNIVGPSGAARRDFYSKSVGFGFIVFATGDLNPKGIKPWIHIMHWVSFTDVEYLADGLSMNQDMDIGGIGIFIKDENLINGLVNLAMTEIPNAEEKAFFEEVGGNTIGHMETHLRNTMAR